VETLGQTLKAAREKKRLTLSEAALKTRIKVQHLEAIERDDFGGMPAPAYAKGFIRMYAEFLGLDSVPMIQEYQDKHLGQARQPSLQGEGEPGPAGARGGDAGALLARLKAALAGAAAKRLVTGVAALALLALLAVGLKRCSPARSPEGIGRGPAAVPQAVVREPPEPYLPVPKAAAQP